MIFHSQIWDVRTDIANIIIMNAAVTNTKAMVLLLQNSRCSFNKLYKKCDYVAAQLYCNYNI